MELRDRSFDIFQSDLSEVGILDEDVSEDEVDSALSNLAKPIEAAIARPRSLQRTSMKKHSNPPLGRERLLMLSVPNSTGQTKAAAEDWEFPRRDA